ncbi:MAG: hypothetical protein H7Z15_10910 [Rhizobacter sp.]|nr:hypothetical protein [Rhizobacter sp.]
MAPKSTPLCRSASQTGCAISYVSFRANTPPPEKSLFVAAQPKVWFSKRADVSSATGKGSAKWQTLVASVETPFFAVPGLVSTQCVSDTNGSYLAAKVHPDNRSDDIGGDMVAGGMLIDNWGLRLIDVSLGLGDIVDVVGQQAKAYLARAK